MLLFKLDVTKPRELESLERRFEELVTGLRSGIEIDNLTSGTCV